MQNKDYDKCLLNFYYELPDYLIDQQKMFTANAVTSYKSKNIYETVDKLLYQTKKRQESINLYNKLEIVFSRMTSEEIGILERRYKYYDLNYKSNAEKRKYYRLLKNSLRHFRELLGYLGINEDNFSTLLGEQPYLSSIYSKMKLYQKNT